MSTSESAVEAAVGGERRSGAGGWGVLRGPGRGRWRLAVAGLVLGLLAAYLAGSGQTPLWDRDEPRYAVTTRAMLDTGDFVVPRFLGDLRTAKPPATYWLQAGPMHLMGRNEFAARFPGAVAVAATAGLLVLGTAPLVGRRRALWAGFLFGTCLLTLAIAKLCITDGPLVFCATVMNVALLHLALAGGRRAGPDGSAGNAPGLGRRTIRPILAWWAIWLAVGFGGLVKGPVILGILLMSLLAHAVTAGRTRTLLSHAGPDLRRGNGEPSRWSLLLRTRPWWGIPLALAINLPWIIAVEREAPGFVLGALRHDIGTRATAGLEGHGAPPGYHAIAILGTWFPWSVLLPAVLVLAWRKRHEARTRLLLAMVLGPWVMFELVVTKLPHYLMPLFPMLALLTADWVVAALRRLRRSGAWAMRESDAPGGAGPRQGGSVDVAWWFNVTRRPAAVIYVLVALGTVATPFVLEAPAWAGIIGAVFALAWGIVAAGWWWQGRLREGLLGAGIGLAVVGAVAYGVWLPQVPTRNISRDIAAVLGEHGAPFAVMVNYKEPSLGWYAQELGTVMRESREGALVDPDARDGEGNPVFAPRPEALEPVGWPAGREVPIDWAVTRRWVLENQPAEAQEQWEVVESISTRLYRRSEEPSDVLVLRRRGERTASQGE